MDRINNIPTNGGLAYREGVMAGDCPYLEDDWENYDRWNNEWDAAADEGQELPKVGSVVTNRYRAKYSEQGHPTHCGDALAELLNSLCNNKAGTNLELFERICAANGVDLSKYNRTGKGWQGRLRMTGRNLLSKKVAENNGVLIIPEGLGEDQYKFDADWVEYTRNKYKPKKDEATW